MAATTTVSGNGSSSSVVAAAVTGTAHQPPSAAAAVSSISSLFERVTNFRRSLIKNQHKKKSRPQQHQQQSSAGNFNLLTAVTAAEQSAVADANDTIDGGRRCPTAPRSARTDDAVTAAMAPTLSVHVDEEDAIYGFTSINLNNPKRRVLKSVPPAAAAAATATDPLARMSSSSCISLYETIDECEDGGEHPAAPPLNHRNAAAAAKFCKANNKSSRYHSRIYSPIGPEPDWRRNRRSSAILLGTNQQDFEAAFNVDLPQQQLPAPGPTPPPPPPPPPLPPHGPPTTATVASRSSDDLLISVATSCSQRKSSDAGLGSSARIYENLSPADGNHHHQQHQQRSSHHQRKCHFPDPRKLTKDSGYESSSTLVSLTNVFANNSNAAIGSSGYGVLGTPKATISNPNLIGVEHVRSDSIDSSLSHKSFDSPTAMAQVGPAATGSPESGDDLGDRESLPPTPPTRYSSLPEHYRRSRRQLKHNDVDATNDDRSRMANPPPDGSSWPYGLYPRMNRRKLQRENPYDNDEPQLPPPPLPAVAQIARSHPVPPIQRQETATNIKEIQKRAVYEFYLRQREKKSRDQHQEQAVKSAGDETGHYCQVPGGGELESPLPPPPLPAPTLQCTDLDDIDVIPPPPPPPLPLPSPSATPPPRPVATVEPNLERSRGEPDDQKRESLDQFPPPPSPLAAGCNGDGDWRQAPPNLNAVLQLLDQRHLDLINLWPSVDFTPLIPMLMVVFNNAPDEDDETDVTGDDDNFDDAAAGAIEPELIRIDQNRKWKHRMLSRNNLLQMERARIEADLARNEKLAHFIRHRLGQLDTVQTKKLELLTEDMARIIGLIFSLHRQLVNQQEAARSGDAGAEKLARLTEQLEQARQLRDAIEQRGRMFVQRIERRFGQLGYGQLLTMIINHQAVQPAQASGSGVGNGGASDDIISAMFEHGGGASGGGGCAGGQDINLSSMSRSYLSRLEMLTVQRHLLDFLIAQQIGPGDEITSCMPP